ncbi:MAG: hypothetical protein ACRD43_15425, partial [Pyrinomonadaceae bacterium]
RNVTRVFRRIFSEPNATARTTAPDPGSESITVSPPLSSGGNDILERLSAESPRFAGLAATEAGLLEHLDPAKFETLDYRYQLSAAIETSTDFRGKLAQLRRTWHSEILRIVVADIYGTITTRRSRTEQTALAEASIDAAFSIADFEMSRRLLITETMPKMAALALGKLGGGSVDLDSDLDLVLAYDDSAALPVGDIRHAEFFSRFTELFVTALSSMTRDGSLYRVDLRLRPHGKNGPSSISLRALADYTANEAAIWELLAYVKLRGAGGDPHLAQTAEYSIREIVQKRASLIDAAALSSETLSVRRRLEKERAGLLKASEVDIKYGEGGLLDIYFATRFLQLRDQVPDMPESRSTGSILDRLLEKGSVTADDHAAFASGYAFLSELDHHIRITIGRNTRVPFTNPRVMSLIAKRMNMSSVEEIVERLTIHRMEIRQSFENVLGS